MSAEPGATRGSGLSRHAVPLLLLAAILYVLLVWTLPALRDRSLMHERRAAAELQLERTWQEHQGVETWVHAAEGDWLTQERLRDLERLSPDVIGPQTVPADGTGP